MRKLSRPSAFLLKYLNNRFPLGISAVTPIDGATFEEQPGMVHMRGLIRRGWARESGECTGLFFITKEGAIAATELTGSLP